MTLFTNIYSQEAVNAQRPTCDCKTLDDPGAENIVHGEDRDFSDGAYLRLEALIEEAVAKNTREFAPGRALSPRDWASISVLPPSIAKMKSVRKVVLYGSSLTRVPCEIGGMTNLEELITYTSYRLHWYPYELTRCAALRSSSVSTRALYGNYKNKMPFPDLRMPANMKALAPYLPGACSVCDHPLSKEPVVRWTSQMVATDVLPLLVTACSHECLARLPEPHKSAFRRPHRGGRSLEIPGDVR